MTDMAKRMLRDRIMDRARGRGYDDDSDYADRRGMRDRAMDHVAYEDSRRGANGRYVRDRDDGRDERYDRYEPYDDRHGHGQNTKLKLPKEDMKRWAENLENEDGTDGPHFEKRMLRERIKHMGHELEGYTEDDLCMAANMLYSDYCEVLHPYISREPEKEADFYLKMAKAFLEDKDAPDGSAKLAMYYFCIADVDE